MEAPSPTHALPAPAGGSPGAGRSRPRRLLAAAGVVVVLALAALAAAALIPGSHATPNEQARRAVATRTSASNPLRRQSTVVDSKISAARYGEKIAAIENGVSRDGAPISDLSPIPPRRFDHAIAEFRGYAERWAGRLAGASAALTAALRSGDRARARAHWMAALSDYLHLGATYNLLPSGLDNRLAAVPTSPAQTRFPGLHRIEKGLWTSEPPAALVPVARRVQRAVVDLRRVLRHVRIHPTDYVRRAHEILEDAQRDLMSGAEVPWSHAGVLGTAASVAASRELMRTLTPLLAGRSNTLGESRYWLARLGGDLRSVRRPDGTYPALGKLPRLQRERLDSALTGALGVLEQVPDTLETRLPRPIPKLPGAASPAGSGSSGSSQSSGGGR